MRNNFVYFVLYYSPTLGKHLQHPAGCGSIFPAKSCQDAWRSGNQLVRGQVNMVDGTKLRSPIHSTFEALVVRCMVGHYGEELAPFCWPMSATGTAVFHASHIFAEHPSQMKWFHWDSESCSGSDGQQTTKQWPWPFLGWKFGFGKCFGASSRSNHWTGHRWLLSKIQFSSHVTIWKVACCCVE